MEGNGKELDLDCPGCRTNMIKSYADEVKLRMKIIKWNRGGMFAVCKSCGQDVPITPEILRSIHTKFAYEVDGDR